MKRWKIIVNLYQAQDLIAADDDGSSDPICEIYFWGRIFRSQPIENTLNPVIIQIYDYFKSNHRSGTSEWNFLLNSMI